MPRPVCVECGVEMTLTTSEVVQFNARSTNGAYEQWHADIAKCPRCDTVVAFRYGDKPSWRHHDAHKPELPYAIIEERRG